MSTENKGTAIVTGASSGIGQVYAERLAARGYDLILVARRLDRLEALVKSIGEKTGRKVEALKADLTQKADVALVEKRLKEDASITLLVNNAGVSLDGSILENDTVIIRKQDTAETGEIVVALIDEEEATLKRLRKRGASIALEAANPAYETRIFGPDRVRVQGKMVSLLRRY